VPARIAGETFRLRKRKRADDDGIEDREHDGIRADAQGQRENRHRREGGSSAKISQGVSQVLHEVVHEVSPTLCARQLVIVLAKRHGDAVVVSETLCRGAPSFVFRQTSFLVIASAHLEVKTKLIVDVGIDVRAEESEIASPALVRWAEAHASVGAALSTCVTAPA
jgi:hypothetical protein